MIQIAMRMLASPKDSKCNSNCDTSNQLSATRKSFSIYHELDGLRYILYMYTTVFLNKHVLYALLNISYYGNVHRGAVTVWGKFLMVDRLTMSIGGRPVVLHQIHITLLK